MVLTTSHKFKYSLSQWLNIFKARNIALSKIDRLPENINHVDRKNEIVNWFKSKTSSDDFIIIDDDKSLNDLPDFLKSRLIQKIASIGLTDELANEILERLKKVNSRIV
ncbi:HAD domain-containing protein [Pedobacter borealis]|uniref:HAD domain-containing protein n=1 Tax=Pedobacter borealis TaxID=475254 RepID=UPI001ADF0C56